MHFKKMSLQEGDNLSYKPANLGNAGGDQFSWPKAQKAEQEQFWDVT